MFLSFWAGMADMVLSTYKVGSGHTNTYVLQGSVPWLVGIVCAVFFAVGMVMLGMRDN